MRPILDRLFVAAIFLLPQHLLSRIILRATRSRVRWFKDLLIRTLMRRFEIDLSEAEQPDPTAYPSFNQFFTRALRRGARPLPDDPEALVSPVDGAISEAGPIDDDLILQAKGHRYSLTALLGGDRERAAPLRGGWFATIYLAPRDYHRIHMPAAGQLERMVYVPGRLHSVNEATVRHLPDLFARNERVACSFAGRTPFSLVLVGALFVGSMETVWAGAITPRKRQLAFWHYENGPSLRRGDEMGRFNMGSTVILLFPPGAVTPDELAPGQTLRMGQRLGRLASSSATSDSSPA